MKECSSFFCAAAHLVSEFGIRVTGFGFWVRDSIRFQLSDEIESPNLVKQIPGGFLFLPSEFGLVLLMEESCRVRVPVCRKSS